MWTIGENSWIKYGWGSAMSEEWSRGEELYIDFKLLEDSMLSVDAATLTVNNIVKNYPAPYTLMCSGGVDSQAMIWAWHMSGHPFEVVTIKYYSTNIWFNEYDQLELTEFTRLYNIPVTYIDFDIIPFLENDLSRTSLINDCDSPQICTHIKMTEFIKTGTIMFSGNFGNAEHRPTLTYTLLGMHRHACLVEQPNRRIIPFFLLHTPELSCSFKKVSYSPSDGIGYIKRCSIYQKHNFPVIPQPAKYNGFEKLKEYYDQFPSRVDRKTRLIYSGRPSDRVFDLLFRYPLEKLTNRKNSTGSIHTFAR